MSNNATAAIQEFTHAQQELVRTAKLVGASSPDAQAVAQAEQQLNTTKTQAEAALKTRSN